MFAIGFESLVGVVDKSRVGFIFLLNIKENFCSKQCLICLSIQLFLFFF